MARWLLLSLSLLSVRADHHCTKGRLFVSDKNDAKVHVVDLDTMSIPTTFDVPIPSARLLATDTEMATVVSVDRGTDQQGTVHFFNPGLSTDDHGDHVDVAKSTPSVHSYSLKGWKPTHITYSAGYVNVFMDGVWSTNPADDVHNSSAVFIKESSLSSATPTVIEVPIPGAHHGVTYALSDDHFVMTMTTEARMMRVSGASSLPDHFVVTNATGDVVMELGNATSPSCPAYHGAGFIGSTLVTGCAGHWFRMTYSGQASPPVTWEKVSFPSPSDAAGVAFRSGTVRVNKAGGIFVGDMSPVDRSPTPRYVASMSSDSSVAAGNLMKTTRLADENDACHWGVDLASDTDGTHVAVLYKDGNMSVAEVSASAIGTPVVGAVFDSAIECSDTSMVPGRGVMYILVSSGTPRLLTVNLHEILAGHADHAVSSQRLSFTPSGGALAVPPSVACAAEGHGDEDHHDGHDHGGDGETSGTTFMVAATWPLLLAAALWSC